MVASESNLGRGREIVASESNLGKGRDSGK